MVCWRITLANLSVSKTEIGRNEVLIQDVSVDLGPGEILVLLGPNGSGKSTLLQTICGMIRPLAGTVLLDGKDVTTMRQTERCRKIAWVPQEEFVEFGWTAREFAALGRAALSDSVFESKEDRAATERALELCDATAFADRAMNELSGGERQRVRIARALAQDADVLVLDEPASQLDISHVLSVLDLISQLAEHGKSIVLTVHDVNQALRLRAKWGFINQKRLETFESLEGIHESGVLQRTYNAEFRIIDAQTVVASTSCRTTDLT